MNDLARPKKHEQNPHNRGADQTHQRKDDRDNAMKWLENGFVMKTYFTRLLMNWDSPWLRGMRDDLRFIAFRKKVLATRFKE